MQNNIQMITNNNMQNNIQNNMQMVPNNGMQNNMQMLLNNGIQNKHKIILCLYSQRAMLLELSKPAAHRFLDKAGAV